MLNFAEYILISENFNQMKSLVAKNNGDKNYEQLLKTIIGVDSGYTKICTDTKINEMYGDISFKINEQKERSMRPYLGMFAKMFYEEKCTLEIISFIVHYIIENKATINKLVVKNNHTGETQVLSNMLDIFKYKDSIHINDNRPSYEIITDAIRDKDRNKNVTDFINKIPSHLKVFFKEEKYYEKISELISSYDSLDAIVRQSIYQTFFGSVDRTGKISRYKNANEFLKDFETLIENGSDFNIDAIKNDILKTRGAKLIECNYEKNYIIADIWNHYASTILGEPSSWCISYTDSSEYWYDNYMKLNSKRKMFFIWNFNLSISDPLSKIAANLNSDGTINLVCDKNDKSINNSFVSYLEESDIDKTFISIPVSDEEFEFKKTYEALLVYRTAKMFRDLTYENYKIELPKVLNIIVENKFDISPRLLFDAIISLKFKLSVSEYIYFFNAIIDAFGIEKYEKNLFTHFIHIIIDDVFDASAIQDIESLFIRLNKNIDYIYINMRCNKMVDFIEKNIPFLYEIISRDVIPLFFKYPDICSFIFFKIVDYKILDENFEKLFNLDFISSHLNNIFQEIQGTVTENNFLQKLNDNNFDFNRYGTWRGDLVHITQTTGFFDTIYNESNFGYMFSIMGEFLKETNKGILDTEKLNNFFKINNTSLIEFFDNYNFAFGYVKDVVEFSKICDLDISLLNFKYAVSKHEMEYISERFDMDDSLCLISEGKLTLRPDCIIDFMQYLYNSPNVYEKYTSYIDVMFDDELFNLFLESKMHLELNSDMILQNIELSKKILNENYYRLSMIYQFIKTDNKELIDLSLIKIVEYSNLPLSEYNKQSIIDSFFDAEVPLYIKEYILQNINFSSEYISGYVTNMDDIKLLMDNKIPYKDEYLYRIFDKGLFKEYNNKTIYIIDKISKNNKFELLEYSHKFYLNDINVIKYITERNPASKEKMGACDEVGDAILRTDDIEKIRFFDEIGMVYPNLHKLSTRYYASHTYYYGINAINYILEYTNSDDLDVVKLFRLMKDVETFKYFFTKYKLAYSREMYGIINDILTAKYRNATSVLNYLKSEIPDMIEKIIMEHYEINKRKKVYSDDVKDWIKVNYYTKAKVKKIREMYSAYFR